MIKACSNSQGCVWVGYSPAHDHVLVAPAEDAPGLAGVAAGKFTMDALRVDAATIKAGSLNLGDAEDR